MQSSHSSQIKKSKMTTAYNLTTFLAVVKGLGYFKQDTDSDQSKIDISQISAACETFEDIHNTLTSGASSASSGKKGKKTKSSKSSKKPSNKRKHEDDPDDSTTKSAIPTEDNEEDDEEGEKSAGAPSKKKYKSSKTYTPTTHMCGAVFLTTPDKTKHTKINKEKGKPNSYNCAFRTELDNFPFCACGFPLNSKQITSDSWVEAIQEGQFKAVLSDHINDCPSFKKTQTTLARHCKTLQRQPGLVIDEFKINVEFDNMAETLKQKAIKILAVTNNGRENGKASNKKTAAFGCIGCWQDFQTAEETDEHVKNCKEYSENILTICKDMTNSLYSQNYSKENYDFSAFVKMDELKKYVTELKTKTITRRILTPFCMDEDEEPEPVKTPQKQQVASSTQKSKSTPPSKNHPVEPSGKTPVSNQSTKGAQQTNGKKKVVSVVADEEEDEEVEQEEEEEEEEQHEEGEEEEEAEQRQKINKAPHKAAREEKENAEEEENGGAEDEGDGSQEDLVEHAPSKKGAKEKPVEDDGMEVDIPVMATPIRAAGKSPATLKKIVEQNGMKEGVVNKSQKSSQESQKQSPQAHQKPSATQTQPTPNQSSPSLHNGNKKVEAKDSSPQKITPSAPSVQKATNQQLPTGSRFGASSGVTQLRNNFQKTGQTSTTTTSLPVPPVNKNTTGKSTSSEAEDPIVN